jgi:large subunit ribosomal protein L15
VAAPARAARPPAAARRARARARTCPPTSPIQRQVPKLKGFANPNRVEYAPVNVELLATHFDGEVTPEALYAHGLARKGSKVKVLGRGEIAKALVVKAHAFSETAKAKIEAAGGRAETIA